MKKVHRWQRILILSFLGFTVVAPLVFVSNRLKTFSSIGRKEFIEDGRIKYRADAVKLKLNAVEQEAAVGLKEPKLIIYKEKDFSSVVSLRYSDGKNDSKQSRTMGDTNLRLGQSENARYAAEFESNRSNDEIEDKKSQILQETASSKPGAKLQGQFHQTIVQRDQNVRPPARKAKDEKVKEMKDRLVRAKAYLNFAPAGSNSHLVKELRLRIKELERAMGEADKDSDLSRSALQKMRSMEVTLNKASHIFPDCHSMAQKLRAMTYNAEEQVRAQQNQAAYLVHLAARTTPKGLHCLSMRLTTQYLKLPAEERQFPNQQKVNDPDKYHYAVFTDNVMACAVVVNSTVSSAKEPEKIVFHVVTDYLNLPAISMWFLSNPPGKATIQIQSINNLEIFSAKYISIVKTQNSQDPRHTSELNYLRFYLPEVFPVLNKIVLFDHDVVVQGDVTGLWRIEMNGKVNAAVKTCQESEASFSRMDMFINFSDPYVAKRFDAKACTWAFGMNVFDLQEWRRQNLTALYHEYLQKGYERPLWKAGSLPLGWATFYNRTVFLDKTWHRVGLGHDSEIEAADIQRAAVLHYDGVLKPWLDIGIGKYKRYWSKHVNYDLPFLQQCNIHE